MKNNNKLTITTIRLPSYTIKDFEIMKEDIYKKYRWLFNYIFYVFIIPTWSLSSLFDNVYS